MGMRILVVSRLYPLPENPGRGIFVQDHVHLLKSLGHEVEVLHVLPRMFKFQESRRSTMEGVSTAPKSYEIHGQKVLTVRHFEWPNWLKRRFRATRSGRKGPIRSGRKFLKVQFVVGEKF